MYSTVLELSQVQVRTCKKGRVGTVTCGIRLCNSVGNRALQVGRSCQHSAFLQEKTGFKLKWQYYKWANDKQ